MASRDVSLSVDGDDQLSSAPLIKIDPVRAPSSKRSMDSEVGIHTIFSPAIFSPVPEYNFSSYLSYLPIYALQRVKEYFLLI